MKKMAFCFAKMRLKLAGFFVNVAKIRMNRVIHNSRAAKEEIEQSYEKFLKRCKCKEKAAVEFKRLQRKNSDRPILKTDLGVEHYIISADLSDRITRLEAERAITRHRYGDWGEISRQSWWENNRKAGKGEGAICSRYPLFGKGFFLVESRQKGNAAFLSLEGESA